MASARLPLVAGSCSGPVITSPQIRTERGFHRATSSPQSEPGCHCSYPGTRLAGREARSPLGGRPHQHGLAGSQQEADSCPSVCPSLTVPGMVTSP